MNEQEFRVDFREPARQFGNRCGGTGRMLTQKSFFKGSHAFWYVTIRWPLEIVLRQVYHSVLTCPWIDSAKPVPVHAAKEFGREARVFCYHIGEEVLLRLEERPCLKAVHDHGRSDTEQV